MLLLFAAWRTFCRPVWANPDQFRFLQDSVSLARQDERRKELGVKMDGINWFAVIAAALAMFGIGGLWYSPLLFGKAWMRENGLTDEALRSGSTVKIFGFAAVFSLMMAANLAAFLNDDALTLGFAVAASLAAGLGWAASGLAVVALFERRSWAYILINGGYLTVAFLAMGLILGSWR